MHTIGEVAEMLGISAHTLRYYEKEQIIIPLRDANGDRRYNESHLKWLQFVIKLKETQMPLAVIQQYASLFQEGEHTAPERLRLLENHKKSVEQQMNILHAANEMLELKITAYRSLIGK